MIDWLSATREDRRALYRQTKAIVDRRFGGDWSRFYAVIPGHVAPGGHGDQDNFRAGRISRKRAAVIFDWIEANHPDTADDITAALGGDDARPAPDWEALLQRRGEQGRLRLVPMDDPSLSIVAFAAQKPLERLRLGQPFAFALDSAHAGMALALQSVDGKWYPLPLSADTITAPAVIGDQFLPRDADTNAPIPLSEDAHAGTHRFAFLIGREAMSDIKPFQVGRSIALDQLNRLARSWAAVDGCAVHRLEVLFTP